MVCSIIFMHELIFVSIDGTSIFICFFYYSLCLGCFSTLNASIRVNRFFSFCNINVCLFGGFRSHFRITLMLYLILARVFFHKTYIICVVCCYFCFVLFSFGFFSFLHCTFDIHLLVQIFLGNNNYI